MSCGCVLRSVHEKKGAPPAREGLASVSITNSGPSYWRVLLEKIVVLFSAAVPMFLLPLLLPVVIDLNPLGLLLPAIGTAPWHIKALGKETAMFLSRKNELVSALNASQGSVFHLLLASPGDRCSWGRKDVNTCCPLSKPCIMATEG
jgi:hypothetical protein